MNCSKPGHLSQDCDLSKRIATVTLVSEEDEQYEKFELSVETVSQAIQIPSDEKSSELPQSTQVTLTKSSQQKREISKASKSLESDYSVSSQENSPEPKKPQCDLDLSRMAEEDDLLEDMAQRLNNAFKNTKT